MGTKRTLFRALLVKPLVSLVHAIDWTLFKLGAADVMATKSELSDVFSAETHSVPNSRYPFRMYVPSAMAYHRAQNALIKEPETIAWIDNFEPGSVFWDIGANVGNFSIYALIRHDDMEVVAFEPSVSNIAALVRNAQLNRCSDRLALIPLPLTQTTGIGEMSLASQEIGGALNVFGVDYDWTGQKNKTAALTYRTLGLDAKDYLALTKGRAPNYIKIDVDGIEHLILAGLESILSGPSVRSVLVEINEQFKEHCDQCKQILNRHGFVNVEKRHDAKFMAGGVSNFIFARG
jgi:FkbM family methyltransferase